MQIFFDNIVQVDYICSMRYTNEEIKTITMYSSYEINEDGILVYKGIGSSVKGIINEYEVYAIGLYGLIHGSMLAEELGFVYIRILKAGKSTYKAFQKN